MKQVVLNLRSGEINVEDVPVPLAEAGRVLVRNHYSLISAGTETMTIELAEKSLLQKARARPDLARKVIQKARTDGPIAAYTQAMGRLEKPEPLGYSCAGEVIAVGEGVDGIAVGDMVACAGASYAHHAEIVSVPRNLCVKVPRGLDPRFAAFSTVGAIALHGVRTADVKIGETVAVIGLGLLGQLACQILRAAGCSVIGIDLEQAKADLARKLACDVAFQRSDPALVSGVMSATGGVGVDAVVITAATSSNDPVELAGELVRDRGRVVVVGAVRIDVPRNLYYEKEANVLISRSYGPGRYDRSYEEGGLDYPIGYVRWTENRNLEAFAQLAARGDLKLDELITHTFGIEQAVSAYDVLHGKDQQPFLAMLFRYALDRPIERRVELSSAAERPSSSTRIVRIGMIGAGAFATATLLPALQQAKLPVELVGLCTATGISAARTGEKYGFRYVTTDAEEILKDASIDAVIIATRNSLHATLATRALAAGKHVFVEKPLAVDEKELDDLERTWRRSGRVLAVGLNRRHSETGQALRGFFGSRTSPMIAHYRVNAEAIPPNHWIYDKTEGGGRLLTEVCHFADYLDFLISSEPVRVYAATARASKGDLDPRVPENVVITIEYADGSLANIVYSNAGDMAMGKEVIEAFNGTRSARLTDFRRLETFANGRRKAVTKLVSDKGHRRELAVWTDAILGKASAADKTSEASLRTSRLIFRALAAIAAGTPQVVTQAEAGRKEEG